MLSWVLHTLGAHRMVAPGDRVLVAVSGGPDSMALLHALWELRERLGLTLEVVTVDHGLRAEARAEGELVRDRAAALELPWHGVRVDVAAARQGRASLQDGARRARLAALAALATSLGAQRVALGHQADDQAETILFRVVRGTGLAGLTGIPPCRGPFIRPLLDVSRAQVLAYLRQRSIPFVEDPSNADARYTRARLRHRVMPLLAQENPRIREALLSLAAAARAVMPAPAGATEATAPRARAGGAGPGATPAEPGALGELYVGRRAAGVIARLQAAGAGTRVVDVAGGLSVEVAYGELRVRAADSRGGDSRGGDSRGAALRGGDVARAVAPVAVVGPGRYALPGAEGTLWVGPDAPQESPAFTFDADALAWPLSLRTRRPGDRMRPRGGRGSRKLSDLLIDAKVPRAARARLPVLTTADDIVLFVPGLRPAEWGRPGPGTTRLLHVAHGPGTPAPTGVTQTSV
jgi:tRNA(Ile)-lysidine synthase